MAAIRPGEANTLVRFAFADMALSSFTSFWSLRSSLTIVGLDRAVVTSVLVLEFNLIHFAINNHIPLFIMRI